MQKNMQEVQSLIMGAEPPVQKTYIVEIEPRLKSKFVLTENSKNLSAEAIIYVSQKERQQQTAYQTQKAAISRIPNIDTMVLNRRNATVNGLLEESGINLTPRNETVGDMLKRNGIDIYGK